MKNLKLLHVFVPVWTMLCALDGRLFATQVSSINSELGQYQAQNDNVSGTANLMQLDTKRTMDNGVKSFDRFNIKIEVYGNRRIETTMIKEVVVQAIDALGDITEEVTDIIFRRLFKTGYFAKIDITIKSGNTVVVNVKEHPIVEQYVFEGNKTIDDRKFNEYLKDELKPRTTLSMDKLKTMTAKIISIYKGTGNMAATVIPQIIKLPDNRVTIVFKINERKSASVKRIYFIGNTGISDSSLKEILPIKERPWYDFWSSDDLYDPGKLEMSRSIIEKFYKSKGYADFRIDDMFTELSVDSRSFYITVKLSEGKIYNFGNVSLQSGIKNFERKLVDVLLKTIKTGELFNIVLLDQVKSGIANELAKEGYIFSEVVYKVITDPITKTADVEFSIAECPKVYINKIIIQGNTRTKDEVIRRELLLGEQDPLQTEKLARSIERIQSLQFFSAVTPVREIVGLNKVNLKIKVKEASTAVAGLALELASKNNIGLNLSYTERNLLGSGNSVNTTIRFGKYNKGISGSYGIPYFLGRNMDFSTSAVLEKENRMDTTSMKSTIAGIGCSVGYSINRKMYHSVGISFQHSNTHTDLKKKTDLRYPYEKEINQIFDEARGKKNRNRIYSSLIYSDLDSIINPRKGHSAQIEASYTGLMGNVKFPSIELTMKKFFPMFEKSVLMIKAEGGLMGNGGFIQDRFALGGGNLMTGGIEFKGFDLDGIGPRINSKASKETEALHGTKYYLGTVAIGVPIIEGMGRVNLLGFAQVGSVWGARVPDGTEAIVHDDKNLLRASVGFGLEWMSPMGPIAITYSKALKKAPYDKTERFQLGCKLID